MSDTTTDLRLTHPAHIYIATVASLFLAIWKVNGVISWSWLAVTAPLWFPYLLFFTVVVVAVVGFGVMLAVAVVNDYMRG